MKTKTITVKTYSFDELSNEVKEKVLERYRDINVDFYGWHDFIIGDWKMKLEDLGYQDVKIYYSGFYSQGDGACFEANVNIEKWIKKHRAGRRFRKLLNEVRAGNYAQIWIKQSGLYYHENSAGVLFEGESELSDKAYSQLKEMADWVEEERYELSKKIYKDLEKEYEYLINDEAVINTFKANDFEFLEDGGRQIYI